MDDMYGMVAMKPPDIHQCAQCGSTMARIFKPKQGWRCIVCWIFVED